MFFFTVHSVGRKKVLIKHGALDYVGSQGIRIAVLGPQCAALYLYIFLSDHTKIMQHGLHVAQSLICKVRLCDQQPRHLVLAAVIFYSVIAVEYAQNRLQDPEPRLSLGLLCLKWTADRLHI
jgi:hypothetical protein